MKKIALIVLVMMLMVPVISAEEVQKKRTVEAFPTAGNNPITDSVTQSNTQVLGEAPAVATGNLYQETGQALSNAAHNATNNQQQSYVTMQASTTQGVSTLVSVDTAATGEAMKDILSESSGLKG